MRKMLVIVILAASAMLISAQDKTGYQLPPEAIVSLLDAPQTPSVNLSPDNQTMLLLFRPGLPSIADLSQPELRLAGVRFDPSTHGPSRGSITRSVRNQTIGVKTKTTPTMKNQLPAMLTA